MLRSPPRVYICSVGGEASGVRGVSGVWGAEGGTGVAGECGGAGECVNFA